MRAHLPAGRTLLTSLALPAPADDVAAAQAVIRSRSKPSA